MANDFTTDPSCVALYNFESGAFASDGIGGNDLSNTGADEETTTYKVGSQSAAFVSANSDIMSLADSSLDAGFPFRNADGGSAVMKFTKCAWVYLNTLPSAGGAPFIIFARSTTIDERVLDIRIDGTYLAADNSLHFVKRYNSGANYEYDHFGSAMTTGRWYHVAVTYDEADYSYRIRIWDDTAGDQLGSDVTGNFSNDTDLDDVPFSIGAVTDPNFHFNGYIDEAVVFNRVLSVKEIDAIRAGTFSLNQFGDDDNCVAVWNFEHDDFAGDSKGGNDLTNVGADESTTAYKQGLQSARFVAANEDDMHIADADQDAGFPFRYDDGGSAVTDFTICGWVYITTKPATLGYTAYIIGKYNTGDTQRVFAITLSSDATYYFQLAIGYNSGASYEGWPIDGGGDVNEDRWYHIGISFDSSTHIGTATIWDAQADDYLTYEDSHEYTSAEGGNVLDVDLYLGRRGTDDSGYFDGYLDEFVIFNRVLTTEEIDLIRQQTFPALTDYTLEVDAGSYSVTGTAAALTRTYNDLSAGAGAYAITGADVTLGKVFPLVAEGGAIALTGIAATLFREYPFSPDAGAYAVTGTAATFDRDYVVGAGAGDLAVTGMSATFHVLRDRWSTPGVAATTWQTPGSGSGSYENEGAASGNWEDENDVSILA